MRVCLPPPAGLGPDCGKNFISIERISNLASRRCAIPREFIPRDYGSHDPDCEQETRHSRVTGLGFEALDLFDTYDWPVM